MISIVKGKRVLPFSIFEEQSLVEVNNKFYLNEKEAKQWLLWEPHCIFVPFIYKALPIILIEKGNPWSHPYNERY